MCCSCPLSAAARPAASAKVTAHLGLVVKLLLSRRCSAAAARSTARVPDELCKEDMSSKLPSLHCTAEQQVADGVSTDAMIVHRA